MTRPTPHGRVVRKGELTFVGAINQDTVLRVAKLPTPGETVSPASISISSGGKAANQAVAAAQALRSADVVRLVGAVGDDQAGTRELASLATANVNTEGVVRLAGEVTGQAFVMVEASGENFIALAPGANGGVTHSLNSSQLAGDLIVIQTEMGAAASELAVRLAVQRRVRIVINNAPVIPLSQETLAHADPLVVNEWEAMTMLTTPNNENKPRTLAKALLRETGARSVVVTLGSRGSVMACATGATFIPAHPASIVADTTGAGDVYLGTLAAHLAVTGDLMLAAIRASFAAAAAVTWHGARDPRIGAP